MINPAISVILPVYNSARWLKESVQSILDQTFEDFELIIINDGSTDGSASILREFTDSRIVHAPNEKNMGLIYSLNKGIELAKGDYIARMDADDISLPHRFSKQKAFLDKHTELALVATTVQFINDEGESTGVWELDQRTTTPSSIRKNMPIQNCIAHPTVMGRAEIFKKFRYNSSRKNIEDYDLWLRLLSAGLNIGKVKEPELFYRVHEASITGSHLRKKNFFYKHAAVKTRFFIIEASEGRINAFTLKTLATTALDIVKGIGKSVKNLSR